MYVYQFTINRIKQLSEKKYYKTYDFIEHDTIYHIRNSLYSISKFNETIEWISCRCSVRVHVNAFFEFRNISEKKLLALEGVCICKIKVTLLKYIIFYFAVNGFNCFNTKCIPYHLTCDGVNDCGDYSDEVGYKCGLYTSAVVFLQSDYILKNV